MRVLAVDDDQVTLDLLGVIFDRADIAPLRLAASADAALKILKQPETRIDCLLLDIEMPGTDGIALCSQIRAMPAYRDVPIVMLTAKKDLGSIERAFACGATDYVLKPFEVKEVGARMHVAERMVDAARSQPLIDLKTVSDTQPGVHSFALGNRISIAGADRVISHFALGNYLLQHPKEKLDTCQVFAMHIDNAEELFAQCTTRQFAMVLEDLAGALVATLRDHRLLMAYDGNGTFLCISVGEPLQEPAEIEDQIGARLTERSSLRKSGAPAHVGISVGMPVVPNASKTQRVRKTFDRAHARAMRRAHTKSGPGLDGASDGSGEGYLYRIS